MFEKKSSPSLYAQSKHGENGTLVAAYHFHGTYMVKCYCLFGKQSPAETRV